MEKPTYLQLMLTSMLLIIGMLIKSWVVKLILIAVVIVLIIIQIKHDNRLYKKYKLIDDAELYKKEAEKIRDESTAEAERIKEDCKTEIKTIKDYANKKLTLLNEEYDKLKEKFDILNCEYTYEVSKFILSDNITSEEYKSKYNLSVLKEKDIVKNEKAVEMDQLAKLKSKKQIEMMPNNYSDVLTLKRHLFF